MKTLAFCLALIIMAFGAIGILVPTDLLWMAQRAIVSGAFFIIAIVRIALGVVLISAAPVSRAPNTVRVLGFLVLIVGVTTALTGLVGIGRDGAIIEWLSQQGLGVLRFSSVLVFALGGIIAYAFAPTRRTVRQEAEPE